MKRDDMVVKTERINATGGKEGRYEGKEQKKGKLADPDLVEKLLEQIPTLLKMFGNIQEAWEFEKKIFQGFVIAKEVALQNFGLSMGY